MSYSKFIPPKFFRLSVLILFFLFGNSFAFSQTLKMGNGQEPKTLDPGLATGITEINIINNLFEGLTTLDPYTLDPKPGIAESWDVDTTRTIYTFKIRKNAKWSDGTKITANDVMWSWKRVLNPSLAAEYAHNLFSIKNAKNYYEKINHVKGQDKTKLEKELGLRVLGEDKLQVTLKHPIPHFLQLTAFATLMIVPKHIIEQKHKTPWTDPSRLVSSGPYVLKEWKMNQHIKVQRNPHYYAKAMGAETAYFYPFEQEQSEENMFRQGKLHLTYRIPANKSAFYQKKYKNAAYSPYKADPYLGTYYYRFNISKKPFNDSRVRKALALVLPRELIVNRILRGGETFAGTFTPPGLSGYSPKMVYNKMPSKEDIKDAKKMLADAGYPEGQGFPEVDLLYNTNAKYKKLATAIQQIWKKKLGVTINLLNQEWAMYLSRVNQMDYQMAASSWIADYPYPTTFLDIFKTTRRGNDTGWMSEEFDSLMEQAAKESDEPKRLKLMAAAEELMLRDAPIIPIYHYSMQRLVSKNLRNLDMQGRMMDWSPNQLGLLYLRHFDLADE